jgi:hypothetical protein
MAGIAVLRPVEFLDRMRGRRERHLPPSDLNLKITHTDPVEAAHEIANVVSCQLNCGRELGSVSRAVASRLDDEVTYLQAHHDGGPMLSQLLWVLVRHLQPNNVVETGVARGISSAFILDAMERNANGHLWSADLPPIGNSWSRLVGSAVAAEHRHRWTYTRGASRRVLPRILSQVTPDIFVHDGLHTMENMSWEYATAWERLPSQGLLVSDDIDDSRAWEEFSALVARQWLVSEPHKEGVLAVAQR